MLIEETRLQAPEFPWLPDALARCGTGEWESSAYVRYVTSIDPNQQKSQWQFETNVVINHHSLGMVVIDVQQGDCIGGIEFVDRIDPDA